MKSVLLALTLSAAAHSHNHQSTYWYKCVYTHETHRCHEFPITRKHNRVIGFWRRTTNRLDGTQVRVRFPIFYVPKPKPAMPPGTYQARMLITYYTDLGRMADGQYVHAGAAACGYELGEVENGASHNAHVVIPGVGYLECEDRIGSVQWYHVDVWDPLGAYHGLGFDYRLVTVYP